MIKKLEAWFSQGLKAHTASLINDLVNFALAFTNLNRFYEKLQYRRKRAVFQELFLNKITNKKKLIRNESVLREYSYQKQMLIKAKVLESLGKLASAHKKWIKAVQKELQKFKKM